MPLCLSDVAVGTGTWGIAAVIPKYLSLRLENGKQIEVIPAWKWLLE